VNPALQCKTFAWKLKMMKTNTCIREIGFGFHFYILIICMIIIGQTPIPEFAHLIRVICFLSLIKYEKETPAKKTLNSLPSSVYIGINISREYVLIYML